jgi:hypothetical protein
MGTPEEEKKYKKREKSLKKGRSQVMASEH